MERKNRILIVGGVAGGASCAARARRPCEHCEIVMFDRGPFVSFANFGLPYHVGDVIEDEEKLLVATPKLFRERFDIDVHTETPGGKITPYAAVRIGALLGTSAQAVLLALLPYSLGFAGLSDATIWALSSFAMTDCSRRSFSRCAASRSA